jgi:uncharacterized protein YdeI (YjbR/CyaY-like superfamily)
MLRWARQNDRVSDDVFFPDVAAFDSWLESHHDSSEGIWIRMAKKGSGIRSLSSDEAVDVGLCWGWISGQRKSLDAQFYLQKYVPRRPRSHWSQVNVEKVEQLSAAGRMRPAGLAEVEAAKRDGRWAAAYPPQSAFTIPEDLIRALELNPGAAAAFHASARTAQYTMVLDVLRARTAPSRQAHIAAIIAALADVTDRR